MRKLSLGRACLVWTGMALALASLTAPAAAQEARTMRVDVCVYGGTSGGAIAAAAVAKAGKSVVLIEPGRHLGGMSSGGLGETDIGNKMVIGGMGRDFYRRIGAAYGKDEAWKFEPHVAEQVYADIMRETKVPVLLEHRLVRVEKQGPRIERIVVEKAARDPSNAPSPLPLGQGTNPVTIEAAVFIDAGYEGDLLAAAGVQYHVGREASAQYGEPLNGVRDKTPQHQFGVPVDPYVKPGDAKSGVIPLVQNTAPGNGGTPGGGDKSVQAYNFRMCLTQDPARRVPIAQPAGYDPARYELMARYLRALVEARKPFNAKTFFKIDMMPNAVTDINNQGAVSTDYIGYSHGYPDGDPATRNRIWKAHESYQKGLLYFLTHDPRVPEALRLEMATWGTVQAEFADTAGWPHQLYVREARRMVGRYVVTQADCEHRTTIDDAIGMAAYNMDSHNCQRVIQNGVVRNEGDVQVSPRGPYPVGYRAITPKGDQCSNLIVPVCVSSSHIAYGSIRMEPVFMVLGQSAAMAACQAIDEKKAVQEIDVKKLQAALLAAGQVLEYAAPAGKK
jgi:ribulose 1,5-bisphosphate synthetase/thiazole synthase